MLYVEIISGLWIGNIDVMYNKKFIEDNNISVILNCTTTYKFPDHIGIQNIRVPLSESLYHNLDIIRQYKDKLLTFIDESLDEHNILVCCYDGKTMSPFIISLYLLQYGDINKNKIKGIIRSKNTNISMDYDLELLDL